jgi:hypothetical protein
MSRQVPIVAPFFACYRARMLVCGDLLRTALKASMPSKLLCKSNVERVGFRDVLAT